MILPPRPLFLNAKLPIENVPADDLFVKDITSADPVSQTTMPLKHTVPHATESNPPDSVNCAEMPRNLIDSFQLDTSEQQLEMVEQELNDLVQLGGFYTPQMCRARHHVAIIVPYRNRAKSLAIFLKNLHPFLMQQQIEYGIFVVEQTVGTKFNRGMLLNVGFLEANKFNTWNCYIFHDVDILPMDYRILYRCSNQNPRHLSTVVNVRANE